LRSIRPATTRPATTRFAAWTVAAGLALAACSPMRPSSAAAPEPTNATRGVPGPLPASFVGEIPGAGGPVRWHLDLLPEGRFQLRQTHVGRPAPNAFDDIGRVSIDGPRLTLRGGREAPVFLALRPDGALRKLDTEGRPIVGSGHNDLLQRLPAPAPIEPRLRLAGLFTYMADAPRMQLCVDGRSLPVQMAGDYLALERAYGAVRPVAGAPRLAHVEATIALRPSAEPGRPPLPTLVVERFERLDSESACPPVAPDRPLVGTAWRLVWIDGVPYTPALPGRPAGLQLDGGRAAGSDGCNRIFGPYTQEGDALRLGELAATMMSCPAGMAEARAYTAALAQVRHVAVRGELLEMLDADGTLRLRFRAE
jgi:copper homeostasis protein (lipoprotein)